MNKKIIIVSLQQCQQKWYQSLVVHLELHTCVLGKIQQ